MPNVLTVSEWLKTSVDSIELENASVDDQLKQFDKVGTGIGYVYFITPVTNTTVDEQSTEAKPVIENHLNFRAVFKIANVWYVAVDSNISDIACALIRIIVDSTQPNLPVSQVPPAV